MAVGAVCALALVGAMVLEARSPRVHPFTCVDPDVPAAFDGRRIALVSDIRLGAIWSSPRFLPVALDGATAADAVVLVTTGVGTTVLPLRWFARPEIVLLTQRREEAGQIP